MSSEPKSIKKGPESFLHRRNEIREKAAKMRFAKINKKFTSKIQNDKKIKFKRAERFLSEGKSRDRDAVRLLRVHNANRNRTFQQPSNAASPLLLVVRVHDGKGLTAETEKTLSEKFRLKSLGDAIFTTRNNDTTTKLSEVKPYVIFGTPAQSLVSDLVAKKAFVAGEGGEKVQLVDNTVVEKMMGKECGFVCLEDVTHEVVSVGKQFEKVSNMLEPFKINLDKKTKKMFGNVKEEINTIISRLI